MHLSCLQENFSRALAIVGRAAPTRSTIPILLTVKMETDQGMLKLTASNLELTISTWMGAMIEEEGVIALPYAQLARLVNSLPEDRVDIQLVPSDNPESPANTVKIDCARYHHELVTANPDDFPPTPILDHDHSVTIPHDIMRESIRLTAFSAASDESRPVLTGINFKVKDNDLTMASADGFRLSVYNKKVEDTLSDQEIEAILPAHTMQELDRLLTQHTEPIKISMSPQNGQVMFKLDNTEVIAQLIQGKFPEYQALIPQNPATSVTMAADDIRRAAQSAAVFAQDANSYIKMRLDPPADDQPGTLTITSDSPEVGNSSIQIDIAEYTGEAANIAFNNKFLTDILAIVGKTNITINIVSPTSPASFVFPDDDRLIHTVMPMAVT